MGWLTPQGIARFQERQGGGTRGEKGQARRKVAREREMEKTDEVEKAEGAPRGEERKGFTRSPQSVWMFFQFQPTWAYQFLPGEGDVTFVT